MPDRYSIGAVASATGLTPAVIRMWESRYGAVAPERADSGHRRYSEADVRRLELLKVLVDAGHRIGLIATSSSEELEELVAAIRRPSLLSITGDSTAEIEAAIAALRRLDREAFRRILDESTVRFGPVEALDRFFTPLMRAIGDRCAHGDLGMVHEHLATAEVRGALDSVAGAFPPSSGAPGIVVGTPAWQFHELGAFLVAAAARAEGWRVTYLGPNLPASELAVGVIESGARAVALSVTYVEDRDRLVDEIAKLQRLLPAGVEVIVGGQGAADVSQELEAAGAVHLQRLSDFRVQLERVRRKRLAG